MLCKHEKGVYTFFLYITVTLLKLFYAASVCNDELTGELYSRTESRNMYHNENT